MNGRSKKTLDEVIAAAREQSEQAEWDAECIANGLPVDPKPSRFAATSERISDWWWELKNSRFGEIVEAMIVWPTIILVYIACVAGVFAIALIPLEIALGVVHHATRWRIPRPFDWIELVIAAILTFGYFYRTHTGKKWPEWLERWIPERWVKCDTNKGESNKVQHDLPSRESANR